MSKLIVVSPHLDDAVFSNWHSITKGTELITVFAGLPSKGTSAWWDKLCGQKVSRQMIKSRIAENELAVNPVGAKTIYLDFLDAQYRHSIEDPKKIADEIVKQTADNDRFTFNLAGSAWCHKDHIIVRKAGVELLNRGRNVSFYADIPYMNLPRKPYPMYIKDLERRAEKLVGRPMKAVAVDLNPDVYESKMAAVKQYKSQYAVTNITSFGRLGRYLGRRYEIEIKASA